MKVSTREATAADMTYACATHHAAYREVVVAQFGSWDERLQDGFFNDVWRGGGVEILKIDGVNCGYVLVMPEEAAIRLVELVVHPDWQRRGIGSAFLEQLMARAAGRRVPLRLKVLQKNEAVQLYKRLGFVEEGRTDTHLLLKWQGRTSTMKRGE